MNLTYEYCLPLAAPIANKLGNYYHQDPDDIKQEMLLWVFTDGQKLLDREPEPSDAYLRACLKNAGLAYCNKERAYFQTQNDFYFYKEDDVKRLLPYLGSYEEWQGAEIPEDAVSNLGSDGIEILSDISRVWEKMADNHREALEKRYLDGENYATDAERKLCNRAFAALMKRLNGIDKPKVEMRKVISSARGQWLVGEV